MKHLQRRCLLVLAAVMLAGCCHYVRTSDRQRSESFQAQNGVRIDGQSLSLYVQRRTAVIVNGSLPVATARSKGPKLAIDFEHGQNKSVNGPAHAVAVAADGYFLTAAHCLQNPVVYLVYSDGQTARIAIPRIVAEVFDQARRLDYVIIHVDARLPYVFEWSPAEEVMAETPAVAVGCTDPIALSSNVMGFAQTCLAGRITSVTASASGAVTMCHNLPIRHGDSGGPLVSTNGELLGINTCVTIGLVGAPLSVAIRPDQSWVARVIQQDRLQSAHKPHAPLPISPPNKNPPNLVISLYNDVDGQTTSDEASPTSIDGKH